MVPFHGEEDIATMTRPFRAAALVGAVSALVLAGAPGAAPAVASDGTGNGVRSMPTDREGAALARLAPEAGPVRLGPDGARITLEPVQAPQTGSRGMPPVEIYLILDGVTAAAQPGVIYGVFLNMPEAGSEADRRKHMVGTLNLFDAVPLERPAPGAAPTPGRVVAIPMTDEWTALTGGRRAGKPVTVTFAPLGPERPGPDADHRIGAVRVEAR